MRSRNTPLKPAELTKIRRQDPSRAATPKEREWLEQYKQAVQESSKGELARSFERLDREKVIIQCPLRDQPERLTSEYLALAESKSSCVVVSQTWSEIHRINEAIRAGLKSRGLVAASDVKVTALEKVDLTDAQKRDERFHREGTTLVFNRDSSGFSRGETAQLLGITAEGLVAEGTDKNSKGADQASGSRGCLPAQGIAAGERRPASVESERYFSGRSSAGKRRTGDRPDDSLGRHYREVLGLAASYDRA